VRIVNYKQIRTTTRNRSTNTRRKILATSLRLPTTRAFVVFLQLCVRKNLLVLRIVNQIPHFSTKTYC